MKRITLALSLVILFTAYSTKTNAQYYFYNDTYYDNPLLFELGGSVGVMNCLTDLGGKAGIGKRFVKDLNFGNNNFGGGIYLSAMYKYMVAVRLEGVFGKLSADDIVLASVPKTDIASARYNRNLSFRSNISEISLTMELHPLFILIDWTARDGEPPRYSPYFLAGVGYYSFNPQTKLENRWVDLQPLSTEGQGFAEYPENAVYKLKQVNFPIGVGVKYELSSVVNLRAEFVYRVLTTDYLDDVSTTYIDPVAFINPANGLSSTEAATAIRLYDRQRKKVTGAGGKRGSPAEKDAFFSFNFKLGLAIGRERIR